MLVCNFANLSSFLYEEIKPSVLPHVNRRNTSSNSTHLDFLDFVLFLKKWNFSILVTKSLKKSFVFSNFYHHNVIKEQNEYHIRNQHKKLHRVTYVSTITMFHQKHTPGGPRKIFGKKTPGGVQVCF